MERFFIDLGAWGWAIFLATMGGGMFGIYLTERSDWSLLIPAYMMWAISGLIALIAASILQGAMVANYVLTAIVLPLVVAFLRDHRKRWVLIPAYILLAVDVMLGLMGLGLLKGLLIPAYILLVIAVPFSVSHKPVSKQ
jgi:hypothetical protein